MGFPIIYKYQEPELEEEEFQGEKFFRDYELERTIKYNGLLPFPNKWYLLPPSMKRKIYGYDIGFAFVDAVEFLHKFSWKQLEKDYGIPKEYIDAWKELYPKESSCSER